MKRKCKRCKRKLPECDVKSGRDMCLNCKGAGIESGGFGFHAIEFAWLIPIAIGYFLGDMMGAAIGLLVVFVFMGFLS